MLCGRAAWWEFGTIRFKFVIGCVHTQTTLFDERGRFGVGASLAILRRGLSVQYLSGIKLDPVRCQFNPVQMFLTQTARF